MALFVKPTVVQHFDPLSYAVGYAAALRSAFGLDCVVTSVNDGNHRIGSLHYENRAADLRTHDMKPGQRDIFFQQLHSGLDPLGFDTLIEDPGGAEEHVHCEFDPKPGETFVKKLP